MRLVFAAGFGRRHLFAELGIEPGEVALAEHVLFVGGRAARRPTLAPAAGQARTRRSQALQLNSSYIEY